MEWVEWKLSQHKEQCDSESSGAWLFHGVQGMASNLGNSCWSALFLSVESISHCCPWFERSDPWNSALQETASLPAFCSKALDHVQIIALILDLSIAELSWHPGQSQFYSGTWRGIETRHLESSHLSALSLYHFFFIHAYMKSLCFFFNEKNPIKAEG